MSKYLDFVENNKMRNKITNKAIRKYDSKILNSIQFLKDEEILEIYVAHGLTILKPKNVIIFTTNQSYVVDLNTGSFDSYEKNFLFPKGCLAKMAMTPGSILDNEGNKKFSKVYLAFTKLSSSQRNNLILGNNLIVSHDVKNREIIYHSSLDTERQNLINEGWIVYQTVSESEIIFSVPIDRVFIAAFMLLLGIILIPFTLGMVLLFGFPMFISNFAIVVSAKRKCKLYINEQNQVVKEDM